MEEGARQARGCPAFQIAVLDLQSYIFNPETLSAGKGLCGGKIIVRPDARNLARGYGPDPEKSLVEKKTTIPNKLPTTGLQ